MSTSLRVAVRRLARALRHPGEWSAERYRARSFMAFSAVWPDRWR